MGCYTLTVKLHSVAQRTSVQGRCIYRLQNHHT